MEKEIEIHNFENKNVRIFGSHEEPWFAVKDICKILDLSNVTVASSNIQEKWKKIQKTDNGNGPQEMIVVNESGLYKMIMRSTKPIAEKFQEWVCEEILPSIRKKGHYKLKEINDLKSKIKVLEEENKEISRRVFRRSKTHYNAGECVYIVVNKTIKDKFKLGQTDNINKRLQSFNNANPEEFEVYKHWYTRFNKKLEKLAHDIFEAHRISLSNEWFDISCIEKACEYITTQLQIMEKFDTHKEDEDKKNDKESDKESEDETANLIFIDDKDGLERKKCGTCLLNLPLQTRFYLRKDKPDKDKPAKDKNLDDPSIYRSDCKACCLVKIKELRKKLKTDPTHNKKTCTSCNELLALDLFFKKTDNSLYEDCISCYTKKSDLEETTRQCTECKDLLSISDFHAHTQDVVRNVCKSCRNRRVRDKRYMGDVTIIKCEFCEKDIYSQYMQAHYKTKGCLQKQGKLEGPLRNKPTNYRSNKIIQIDATTGNEIAQFRSIAEASKMTTISSSSISACRRGVYKTSGGFKWS
jgi:prophage antirepressor-like protein